MTAPQSLEAREVSEERLAELIAEHERSAMLYCAMNDVAQPPVNKLLTIAALRELARIRPMAERYEWLRESIGSTWPYEMRPVQNARGYRLSHEDLDAAIDAQLALTARGAG